jgi:hypothetical protein
MAADDHAIVVGINSYPALSNLDGPENDADALVEWLRDPQGGDMPEANVHRYVSSMYANPPQPGGPEPTTVSICRAFEDLIVKGQENAEKEPPEPAGRRLYIFLAGHGVAPPNNMDDAALLMANAGRGRMGHYLPGRPLASHFRGAAYFKEVVLLMDCCRDRLPKVPVVGLPWDEVVNPEGADVEYFYGFATKWSRKARERPLDGPKMRGLFTTSVLKGLRAGNDTPERLKRFVEADLPSIADSRAYQEPVFDASNWQLKLASGDAADVPQLRITFAKPNPTVTVLVRGQGLAPMAEHAMEGDSWVVDLEPGYYGVERSDKPGETVVKVMAGMVDVEI